MPLEMSLHPKTTMTTEEVSRHGQSHLGSKGGLAE